MRIKIFELNRHRETPEQFETRVRAALGAESILDLKVWENLSSSGIAFQFTLGDVAQAPQLFTLWAYLDDLETAEGNANSELEAISHAGRKAQFLSIISLAKTGRSVLAMVVQEVQDDPHGIESSQGTEEAPAESHSAADERADAGTKRGGKRRDRKTPTQ